MKTEDAEFTELSKGLKIKLSLEVMFLHPGCNLFSGKADYLFLEHNLLVGE